MGRPRRPDDEVSASALRKRRLRALRDLGLNRIPVLVSDEALEAWAARGHINGPNDKESAAAIISKLVEEMALRI